MSDPEPSPPGQIDFEDVFEAAPCGYLLADADGRVLRANRTLAGWLGVAATELCGRRLPDLLTVPGKIFYETHFAPTLRMTGTLNEVALELMAADRRKLSVLVSANECRAGEGSGIRFQADEQYLQEQFDVVLL